ncbi:MAG: response regulator [Paludibacter sp.]|jgi:CheY-like chemotaxis protein|nr:response regulator [Paludibacter sp.]
MSEKHKIIRILITEDDDGHAELITEGLRDTGVSNEIMRFNDGLELWEFLNENLKNPLEEDFLILLDINMPRMNGVETLEHIKKHPNMKDIPVIMLTTTDDQREIDKCYQLGCNVYITKPINFTLFAETLKRIGLFIQIMKV